MTELYGYQEDLVTELARHRRPLMCLPTGGGKTVVAGAVVQRAESEAVLFLVHRRELVHQAKRRFADFGVTAGIILAGEPMDQMRRVQIGGVQSIWARCMRSKKLDLPPARLIILDEAHHVRARTYMAILEQYPDARIIGMTATPCRRDGKGLGNVFDSLVEGRRFNN